MSAEVLAIRSFLPSPVLVNWQRACLRGSRISFRAGIQRVTTVAVRTLEWGRPHWCEMGDECQSISAVHPLAGKEALTGLSLAPTFSELFFSKAWESTAVGPRAQWCSALRRCADDMIRASEPMFLVAGEMHVLMFNEACAELLGPTSLDALGCPLHGSAARCWTELEPLIHRALRGEAFIAENLRLGRWFGNDGHHRQCFAAFTPLRDEGGSVIATWGIAKEVHESSTADDMRHRIESLELDLAQKERTGAVEAFGSTVAHELNQPLAAIANFAQVADLLLKDMSTSDQRLHECLDGISAAASKAGAFLRRMREIVRKGPPRLEVVSLREVAEGSVAQVRARLPGAVHFENSIPCSFDVVADCVLVEQVFVHLLKNSLESEGSTRVAISARIVGHMIETTVEDDGAGFGEGRFVDLFVPFRSTKPHGLGLGLAICRTIIEAQGGRIEIQNNVHGGARVSFTLPMSRDSVEA